MPETHASESGMPSNIEPHAQRAVVYVVVGSTMLWLPLMFYGQFGTLRHMRRDAMARHPGVCTALRKHAPSLLKCILTALVAMVFSTFIIVVPIVSKGPIATDRLSYFGAVSSSINFCEPDFVYSPVIGEPVNVVSGLVSYVPLAAFGLAVHTKKQCCRKIRFQLAYAALLVIGLGTVALHTTLTATAQGGDELPMLWWCAAHAFCAIDVGLSIKWSQPRVLIQQNVRLPYSCSWLGNVVASTAAVATAVYVGGRHDFALFFCMFAGSALSISVFIIWINLGHDWRESHPSYGTAFVGCVLGPLSICVGSCAICSMWLWAAEMLLCDTAHQRGPCATFLLTHCVHPLWHCLTALLAWLITQVVVATSAMHQITLTTSRVVDASLPSNELGHGLPSLRSFCGLPYVDVLCP